MLLHTWREIFAQKLKFRHIFTSTAVTLSPSLDGNRWQELHGELSLYASQIVIKHIKTIKQMLMENQDFLGVEAPEETKGESF